MSRKSAMNREVLTLIKDAMHFISTYTDWQADAMGLAPIDMVTSSTLMLEDLKKMRQSLGKLNAYFEGEANHADG